MYFQFLENMELSFSLSILFFSIIQVRCQSSNCSPGDPVMVTDLLETVTYIEAQEQCKVNPSIGNITSYAGFFTVNKQCNSNLFFWFFPALNSNWKTAPVVLWLQGGPGSTSLFGLFQEIGPFKFNGTMNMREYSWNNETNLLFIDQPVGTGFSYTSNITGQGCYPENLTAASNDLYQGVNQFFTLFPDFLENNNKFIIAGESYAGKWIPSLAQTILKNNKNSSIKLKVTALLIGGAYIDPIVQCIYSSYLYYIGLYDETARKIAEGYEEDLKGYIQEKDWTNAAIVCGAQLTGIYNGLAGSNISVYNYIYEKDPEEQYRDLVDTCEMRKSMHVGSKEFQSGDIIAASLNNDTVQSAKGIVEAVLDAGVDMVFYTGQLDIISAHPMVETVLQNLTWSGKNDFLNATRVKWCITNEDQAGFYKSVDKLSLVFFRSCGHYESIDQPSWAYLLLQSVITGSPGNLLHLLQPCNQTNST